MRVRSPDRRRQEVELPLYEYRCGECGRTFEALVPASQADEQACAVCAAPGARRLLSVIAAPVRGGDGAAAPAGGGCCGGACGNC